MTFDCVPHQVRQAQSELSAVTARVQAEAAHASREAQQVSDRALDCVPHQVRESLDGSS